MIINSKKFNFDFFLSSRIEVKNLKTGATKNGGATKINGITYSNIEGDNNILTNDESNFLAVYIPNTMDVDQSIDNSKYIDSTIKFIRNNYKMENVNFENTQGSWYSEDMKKVVYDDITIVSINLKEVKEADIQNFVTIATYIKHEMRQEGVSIAINSSLAIV